MVETKAIAMVDMHWGDDDGRRIPGFMHIRYEGGWAAIEGGGGGHVYDEGQIQLFIKVNLREKGAQFIEGQRGT